MCVCVCMSVYIKGLSGFFILMSRWSIQRIKARNALSLVSCVYCVYQHCRHKGSKHCKCYAVYVDTVDTKHIHTFLPVTFLILNQFLIPKSFGKLRFRALPVLCMWTLSMQVVSIPNAFNAIYVKAVNTFSTQYTHMYCYTLNYSYFKLDNR